MRKEYYSQYSPLDEVDDNGTTKLLDSDIVTSLPPQSRFLDLWPWLSHGVLMSMILVFFTLWARAPSIDDVVLFSPANEAVESIGIIKFNGSFKATSIYRDSPSPELDAIWDEISLNVRPVRMTLEQLLRTGEKPSPAMVRYPDEYGGGYMATVEVIHQLHCLDILRKASWGNIDYNHGDVHISPEEFRTQIDHCVEILRQFSMCGGDVTMITHDWVEGRTKPFADFNVHHQCRNFDKILDWVDEHRVFVPKSQMVRLDDNVDLPSPP
ncbi:uncharacterized protein EDB93DRAFT_1250257 [Suillus bovinus]|uniref:uncharacterized protein n=1 Tax=Suillus bovinus TaxID=48563 RepID=UPI001B85C22D|nr:uncharacterized protein EDB93DRAFT_1250257 [Suillus bovinus]KAG2148190.1 hypothetical protein EDB93DRAFT_1250257 [Suillus bovinus]